MNTDDNLSAGAPGQKPIRGAREPARPSEPPAIQITMPRQDARRQGANQPGADSASMDKFEGMLSRLMSRLDESDRRYTNALEDLNHRLGDLSERAHSARETHTDNTGATLERVREQASSLAAQVSEVTAAHRTRQEPLPYDSEPRMGGFSSANDDGPGPSFGDARLGNEIADVTQRLERSLEAHAPAGDFDALTQRMDDLARRFESALATKNDLAALQTIESQLNSLTAGFTDARQNYARVEAIEGHLANLMDWMHSTSAPVNGGGNDRLGAIEKALHALNENAREMETRTAGTLKAMNDALHSLAANMKTPGAAPENHGFAARDASQEQPPQSGPPQSGPPQSGPPQSGPEDYAEVRIDKRVETNIESREPSREDPLSVEQIGAMIPDYQPAPRGGSEARGAMPQARAELDFEAKNDFIASARRAAAAAAQDPAPLPAKSTRRFKIPMAGMVTGANHSSGNQPRPLLVIAAVSLMIVSAGLLYTGLKSSSPPPASGASQDISPQPPILPPKSAPVDEATPLKPATRAPAENKKQSERIPVEPISPPQAPVTLTSQRVPAPEHAPTPALAVLSGGQGISTATILASLPPNEADQQMPGVTVEIQEPATRSRAAPRAATPALVPPAPDTPRQVLLPLPKRALAPAAASRPKPANATPVDSARANEVTPAADRRQSGMPPARIGPYSLRIAAARGNPAAQVEIASRYAKGTGVPRNLKTAAEWYTRAAAQGFAPGQYRLAALYERGKGVKKDIGMARTWYRRAAEIGNVRAMHNLAVLYTRSGARPADYSSAKNWFYEASRYGLADSQFNLGILYESGLGVKKNTIEAYKWFTLAARQGDAEAGKRREALRPQLAARSLSAAEKSIARWKPAAVSEAANRSAPPRGGWSSAKVEKGHDAGPPGLITRAQTMLNKLGYDAGEADGKLGPRTMAAIRKFEGRTGMARTGKVTPALLQQLEATAS